MNSSSTPLVEIRNYILEKFDLREILGIILVGSYAAGRAKKNSDIDIIILKKNQPSVFERREIRYHEYELDIKLYRHSYLEDTLEREATTSNQLGEISLFLRFLQEAVIWYPTRKIGHGNPNTNIFLSSKGENLKRDGGEEPSMSI